MRKVPEDSEPWLRVATVDPIWPLVFEFVAKLRAAVDTHDGSNPGFTAAAPNEGHVSWLDFVTVARDQPGCLGAGVLQTLLDPKALWIGLEDPVAHKVCSLPV
jgi:hypothetical protein